ncbi:MTRF1L release factor glutamine methyltransferase [Episyrphus balteatus]|uniref:MTRF1L release factor glutamine methyltransferase n=1 Tax=Episyrphus balteatus TaxID=286459 RepID=UPI0024868978|nr:MTRF1L release factor glutamine methyltransferase [Episyrphus balteatus]
MFKLFKLQTVRQMRTFSTARMVDIRDSLDSWKSKLNEAGVGDIDFNLKCIVAHVIKKNFSTVNKYEDVQMSEDEYKEFERLVECRIARMPLQYILGEWDFMDMTLKMQPTVFIPRPETEEFVRLLLEKFDKEKPFTLLEVGCGCGAISLAILHRMKNATSVALERSAIATKLAIENAKLQNLDDRFTAYLHTTTKEALVPEELKNSKFDFVISNPPYVKNSEFPLLQPEVKVYENSNALIGGQDGLHVARSVCDVASNHLVTGGKLWMELGSSHPPLVQTIINTQYEGRLQYLNGYKDQYKQERFVEIAKVYDFSRTLEEDQLQFTYTSF